MNESLPERSDDEVFGVDDGQSEYFLPEITPEELDGLALAATADAPMPKRFRRVDVRSRRKLAPWSKWYVVSALALGTALYLLIKMKDAGGVPPSIQRYDSELRHWPSWLEIVVRWRIEILLSTFILTLAIGIYRGLKISKLSRGVKGTPWVVGTLLGIIALAIGSLVMALLFREANNVDGVERPKLRIEAIKTAASVAVGTSGIGALLLGTRRFWSGEGDKLDEKFDKAVEQIGSDNPAVQVSGMVTLERLAERNPEFKTSVARLLALLATSENRRSEESRVIAMEIIHDMRSYYRPVRRIRENEIE